MLRFGASRGGAMDLQARKAVDLSAADRQRIKKTGPTHLARGIKHVDLWRKGWSRIPNCTRCAGFIVVSSCVDLSRQDRSHTKRPGSELGRGFQRCQRVALH